MRRIYSIVSLSLFVAASAQAGRLHDAISLGKFDEDRAILNEGDSIDQKSFDLAQGKGEILEILHKTQAERNFFQTYKAIHLGGTATPESELIHGALHDSYEEVIKKLETLSPAGHCETAEARSEVNHQKPIHNSLESIPEKKDLPLKFEITENEKIHLDSKKPTVFVTHLNKSFPNHSYGTVLEESLSELLNKAEERNLDVVASNWRIDVNPPDGYMYNPLQVKYWARNATGGSFDENLVIPSPRVVVTGGQFVYCATGTASTVLESWARQKIDGELVLFVPAMYDRAQNSRWPQKVIEKAEREDNNEFTSVARILDHFFESDKERFEFIKSLVNDEYLSKAHGGSHLLEDSEIVLNYRGESETIQLGKSNPGQSPHKISLRFIHPASYDKKSINTALSEVLD